MSLKYLALGFFAKIITGFDDTITHIPVIASITKARLGRIAFSIGTLLAIILAVIISIFFSEVIRKFPYYNYIAAGLLFALAAAIHFSFFVRPRSMAEKSLLKCGAVMGCAKLLGIGFIASSATVIDDIIAYAPLLLNAAFRAYVVAGIMAATLAEIAAVVYFSEKIKNLRHKEDIASAGLIILAVLILIGAV